jgi:hypothetical protein
MEEGGLMFRFIYISMASFALAFATLVLSGIFSAIRPETVFVINSVPLYICSFILLLTVMADVILRRGGRPFLRWATLLSLALLTAGYWVGGLMSFSLEAVITEGQSVHLTNANGDFRPLYVGKYAKVPQMTLLLRELRPWLSSDHKKIESLEGSFSLSGSSIGKVDIEMDIHNGYAAEGFRLSMEGFGYSPRYILRDREGSVLDSSFTFLRLFPPGTEDSFRLLSPLTYYLSYYSPGEGTPYFRVRIARNKDMVFNGDVPLGRAFHYENASMELPEVREWTRLKVKRNPGGMFLEAGMFVFLLGILWEIWKRLSGAWGSKS